MFNHWMLGEFGPANDRRCIEELKVDRRFDAWITQITVESAYNKPHRVTDGLQGSFLRYNADNVISKFVAGVENSKTIEPRINRFWRPGTESRVRKTSTISLDYDQFERAYRIHARVLEEPPHMPTFNLTLHQTLPILGVHSTGSCFYKGPVDSTFGTVHLPAAHRMVELFRTSTKLTNLVEMIDAQNTASFAADILETMYNTRNVAMHGELDFLEPTDNYAARTAFDLLDNLVKSICTGGNW
jgi:hypothetical protein